MTEMVDEAPKLVRGVEARAPRFARDEPEEVFFANCRDRRGIVAAVGKAVEAVLEGRRPTILIYAGSRVGSGF